MRIDRKSNNKQMGIALIINLIALVIVVLLFFVANRKLDRGIQEKLEFTSSLQVAIRVASDTIERLECELKEEKSISERQAKDGVQLTDQVFELKETLREKDKEIKYYRNISDSQSRQICDLLRVVRDLKEAAKSVPDTNHLSDDAIESCGTDSHEAITI